MKLLLLILLLPLPGVAQNADKGRPFPQQQVNEALQKAWHEKGADKEVSMEPAQTTATSPSGIYRLLQGQQSAGKSAAPNTLKSAGILYIGNTPNDTLVITGTWQNNGPVVLLNNAVLIFDNAHATIAGDIIVTSTGQVLGTNSTLYFPQQYFYEWGLQVQHHGLVQLRHCTLDFAGLAHTITTADSATVHLQNVYFTDDNTTTGLNGASSFIVDSANLLGEIVATDSIHLHITHADTVLIWHRVARGQGLTWTFPNGVNLQHYAIGRNSAGVNGIKYDVQLDDIKLAQWALMPDNNSTVNVSNSTIRSVGAIFRGTDTTTVQGLVDYSTYASAANLFTDRNFALTNCTVQTWGLYPTDTATVNITSCITGEIGSGGMAQTNCTSMFNDGSGGYFWSNGFAFQTASGCGFKSPVRAEQSSLMLAGFCSITAATGYAIDSAILILVQTPTLFPPVAYDGADVWVGTLTPQSANAGDSVVLTGSAYILRGPTSHLMQFASYYVAYQAPGSTGYITIGAAATHAVNQNTLVSWPTAGLEPGIYSLILIIKDDHGDSVTVNSSITLQAVGTGIPNLQNNDIKVFPNPVNKQLTITSNQHALKQIRLLNAIGQQVLTYIIADGDIANELNINTASLPAGIYIYQILTATGEALQGKVIKL